jgi:hypothetical protein
MWENINEGFVKPSCKFFGANAQGLKNFSSPRKDGVKENYLV